MTKQGWIKRKANGNGVAWNKGNKTGRSPQYSSVTLLCWECNGYFTVKNYRKDTAHFCSRLCASQYRDKGKRTEDKKIRQSAKYKAWRTLVFERDEYTCVQCGDHNYEGRGGSLMLHADHIQPFALYPELRVPCHIKTGTYGRGAIYRERCIAVA
jgi:hypothetical protein